MPTNNAANTFATGAVALCASLAHAQLALHPLFGDHMVLQRNQPITLRGTTDPGIPVTATIKDATARTQANDDGAWSLTLPPRPAGGPNTITITDADETITLQNVLFGDVWVCSGQSNMDWRLENTDRGQEFIDRAENFTQVRLLKLNRAWDRQPQTTVDTIGWRESSPRMAAAFSGVGFHFGRIINQHTDVPIGLIHTAWGGTPAEAWTPMHTLEARPDIYRARLDSLADYDMPADEAQRRIDEADATHAAFAARAFNEGIGLDNNWHQPDHNDADWITVTQPGWADTQVAAQTESITYNLDGIIWLRKTVALPAASAGKPATLRLARLDDYDETYVNGTLVGSNRLADNARSRARRDYDIPENLLVEGPNLIAVRLMDVRSAGGVIPAESYPFELVHAAGATPLAGEWKARVGFDSQTLGGFPRPASHALPMGRPFRRPAVLYNAMLHPLTQLGVAGVIWYQGESNSGRGDEYRELFPDMINAWRDAWADARDTPGYQLPFYFVQLPNYQKRRDEPAESRWAEIREAQRLALTKTANTGMAITIDIGDPADIHPTNKLPVGERLARLALHDRYTETTSPYTGPHTGPMPTAATRLGNRVIIDFDHAQGLTTSDGSPNVHSVALADDSGQFRWAEANIVGNRVIATVTGLARPTRVRYAWAENPRVNLVNAAGLPATPFQIELE